MWINGNFDSPGKYNFNNLTTLILLKYLIKVYFVYMFIVPYISDVMFRLLRSLVKAYQLGETGCLGTIESDFAPHLTSEQRHLLAVLINTLT